MARPGFLSPAAHGDQKWRARLLRDCQTAWAMTVHKSQGSGFTHTILVLPDHLAKSKRLRFHQLRLPQLIATLDVGQPSTIEILRHRRDQARDHATAMQTDQNLQHHRASKLGYRSMRTGTVKMRLTGRLHPYLSRKSWKSPRCMRDLSRKTAYQQPAFW